MGPMAGPARPARRWPRRLVALAGVPLAACAAGGTLGSGVGDALVARPPYYAGTLRDLSSLPIGHLPVVYQSGASQPAIFDPDQSDAVRSLLETMTAYLDSLGTSVRLVEGGRVSAVTHAATRGGPDVSFGCIPEVPVEGEDCTARGDSALGRGDQRMRLAVTRPSASWTAWMTETMAGAGVGAGLVVTLEVGQYLIRQTGWQGFKEVELGTGHTERLPWLTSLETPVTVLQLTGALVGTDGKALRIGAEGLLARRTELVASGFGLQRLITDEDVAALATARRDDLPGAPLAWQVGLRHLVEQLTGRPPS